MKLNGHKFQGPQEVVIAIPRPPALVPKKHPETQEAMMGEDGAPIMEEVAQDVFFIARAVIDTKEFDVLVPVPLPPPMLFPEGRRGFNTEDREFRKKMEERSGHYVNWLILKSLQATPGLEWETVDMKDPATYPNFRQELLDAGFTPREITEIVNETISVNGIDEDKMKEARSRFLRARLQPQPN